MLIPLDASLLNSPGSGFFVTTSLFDEHEKSIGNKNKYLRCFIISINIILTYNALNLENEVIGYRNSLKLLNDLDNFRRYFPEKTLEFWNTWRGNFANNIGI